MKTIRLRNNGMPKESMSFKNINFCEVFDNDIWEESEAYEIFTTRFMFVVFVPVQNKSIKFVNAKTNETVLEPEYVLKKVFFWTMPTDDLNIANQYWLNIRQNTIDNNLELSSFWSLSDHNKFHVRPKAAKATQLTVNPHGGECKKYCYWLNAEYVKEIIDNASNNV